MNDPEGRMKAGSISTRSKYASILHVFLLALFSLMLASAARAQFTGQQRNEAELAGATVVAVNFEGNKQLSSDELATVTATSVTGVFSRIL